MRPPTTGPAAVEIPTVAPKKPKARPRSAPRNSCWISAEFCGASAPGGEALGEPGRDSSPTVGAAPAAALHSTNARQRREEHPSAAQRVAEPAGRHQGEPERQRVAGRPPTASPAGVGTESPLHRRQRDRDDADVEQAHEPGDEGDRERLPAPRIGLLRRRGGGRRSTRSCPSRATPACLPGAHRSGRLTRPAAPFLEDQREHCSDPRSTRYDGPPPTDLVVEDITAGDGAEATAGQHGRACTTSASRTPPARSSTPPGTAARRSASRSAPAASSRGWDQGVAGMKVGGRRRLVIPPHLGYGDRGAGGAIKPGETLIFVVDLVGVS